MKTMARNVETLSILFTGKYETTFDYLAHPLHQKEWATQFVLEVEEVGGEYIATLPFGKMPLRINANKELGTLDIQMGDGKPTRTRLIEIEPGVCMYNFTLAQPPQMPDAVWFNEGLPNMKAELDQLKNILEKS